jgi:NAD-dependent SIR2 family protein deacetylase
VPRERVARAFAMVDAADALLVAGSSLTVMSGLRFVRHAHKRGIPVVILNRGLTRGDELADLKVDAGCTEALTALAAAL